jgi:hypothetical protein
VSQFDSPLSALDYREIAFRPNGPIRFNRQRGVQQIADSPNPIRDAKLAAVTDLD